MNEQQLVDLLAKHLDALLEGQPLLEPPPDEIAELLPIAQNLAEAAPIPSPEFGSILKESLLGSESGGNGTTGANGSVLGGHQITLIVVIVILALGAILSLLIWTVIMGVTRSTIAEPASPVPPTVQYQATPTSILRPTATNQAADSLPVAAPSATAVLDVLPPINVTVEAVEKPPAPPDLVPGSASAGGDQGGDDDDGDRGDPNRGHGNDPDRHDEDNPGHGGRDDD